jgi:hypothetical protein
VIGEDGRILSRARTAKKKPAAAADTTDVEAGIEDLRKELQSLRELLEEVRRKARSQTPR